MSSVDWRPALVVLLGAIVWADASSAGERETPKELVLRSLGHIQRGEISAAIPLFASESLSEISLDQIVGAIQMLGFSEQIDSRLVTQQSGYGAEDFPVETLVYHLKGPDRALLVVAQVKDTESVPKLVGLSFNSAPLELSELFPFVLKGLSYVHYYVLLAFLCVPALMLYATIQCFRRESGAGWAWIPFILIGVGRVTAVWIPGPPDERLFSFVPMAVIPLGIEMVKIPAFEPWHVSVSAPIGAFLYLWWSGRRSTTPIESKPRPSGSPDSVSTSPKDPQ